ncbi:agamous-like MADS-box protein AGL80 [Gossypium arboreum]|uniref:MADS-box domain-containing protein n=1 Tax=Gossypium arboreum TaxID=29729 RepID=A0ABR0MHF9_GOSAR|nr:agamous-like MADS-box protein AGL80 [Gossypium arboreum]KAK5772583.1 hypothetical protein PVK06_048873 [Gossypium arboreum]
MSRKKIKLAYITNDLARKTTYKKRTKGLVKKVPELTTLCGIEACAIIYAPDFDSQLEVVVPRECMTLAVPSSRSCPVETKQLMVNQESFLEQSLAKATQHLRKLCKENRQKELKTTMFQSLKGKWILHSLNLIDLKELGLLVKQNLKEIDNRVRVLTKARCSSGCY